ncbi:Hypothetical protein NTJ_10562 [Nesidiocoris tenuis]|uniref:Uncharacterized protein n=1 Tax=Nesidiocoris tenuis TaxID=355587 RepID=A0ABN7B007_9HEMI|nr:Hypothetical protein NTJ_10562 [Nesidiocoris tenuis]
MVVEHAREHSRKCCIPTVLRMRFWIGIGFTELGSDKVPALWQRRQKGQGILRFLRSPDPAREEHRRVIRLCLTATNRVQREAGHSLKHLLSSLKQLQKSRN